MKDSNLTLQLELTVSGSEGWQNRVRMALENLGVLVHEVELLEAKGDAGEYAFQYKIVVGDLS
jgi:hypothetical protein